MLAVPRIRLRRPGLRAPKRTSIEDQEGRKDYSFLFLFFSDRLLPPVRSEREICLGSMKQCSQFPVSVLGVPVYARRSAQASRAKKGGRTTAFCFCFSQTDFHLLLNAISEISLPGKHKAQCLSLRILLNGSRTKHTEVYYPTR